MTLEELKDILRTKDEFVEINNWAFRSAKGGRVSRNSYVISRHNLRYFVKEVTDNEANALFLIRPLELEHFIQVLYPDLLWRNILVSEFVPGGELTSKVLDLGLVRDFARMQNTLNDPTYFGKHNSGKCDCLFAVRDDGSWKKACLKSFAEANARMDEMHRYMDSPIVQQFSELLHFLSGNQGTMADELAAMPFAWQHHDFREANIIGRKQVLVDWGSSYGYGPFMYDLAPFLLHNQESLDVYVTESDICRKESKNQIRRWVYASAAARIVSRLRREFVNLTTVDPQIVNRFLSYEYATYKHLLDVVG